MKLLIFALLFNVVNANQIHNQNKPSFRCNPPYGYVEQSPERWANIFMKLIPLTQGYFAQVDDADFDYLMKWSWCAHYHKSGNKWYAERGEYLGGGRKNCKKVTISMHRQLLGIIGTKELGDHKDRNGLNNQRSNLRIATRSQNNANRKSRDIATSKYLGVGFEKDRQKWTARIRKDKKGMRLGCFDTEKEAALAYNKAAIKYHGEFANLNIINQ